MALKVFLIAATTVCGRISPAVMGSEEDRRFLEEMRLQTDASLLGANTLRQGDPEMRGPKGALPQNRLRAVITASGDIPFQNRKLFQNGPRPLLFTSGRIVASLARRAGGLARVIGLPQTPLGLSMKAAIHELRLLGARAILLEGGAKLNYAALREGVVDEILLTLTPRLSGDRAAASLADGPFPLADPFLRLELLSCRAAGTGEIFCRYKVIG